MTEEKKSMPRKLPLITAAGFMLLAVCALVAAVATGALAANPPAGTISLANPTTSYTSGPFFVPNASAQSGTLICNAAQPCDDFALTINVPAGTQISKTVQVQVAWPNVTADFDMYVLSGTNTIATSASSADPETAVIPAVSGNYTVRVVPFNPLGQSITGTVTLQNVPPAPPPGSGPAPRYQNYTPPNGLGTDAGEPSIGVNWNTEVNGNGGTVLFQSYLTTLRVSFDITCTQAIWEDKSAPTSVQSLDPILFTDSVTGRTFVSQLTGENSLSSFTSDDGNTYTPSTGGPINSGADHQTIGGGPFSASDPITATTTYTHAVYYCSQSIATAFCGLSRNGGLDYNGNGGGIPIYTLADGCGGLHGHVKVAPDGTVYVPNKGCGARQAVAVSDGNNPVGSDGRQWAVRGVPDSLPAIGSDPSVGIASDGTVYFGYQDGTGHPKIAVSHNRGLTWAPSYDVGAQLGIQNSVFPEVVAGDPNRAAFAFVGTTTGGDYQNAATFTGIWHMYIASTFDGGATWITVDSTPNDPVQRGSICTGGTTCGQDRNLLDFNDITVDKRGRVLVGYADGCIGPCVQGGANSFSALATITRQTGGPRLFAQYDPTEPTVPGPVVLTGSRSAGGVNLSWTAPDNGGSTICGYRIMRGLTPGSEVTIATLGSCASPDQRTTYTDTTADPNTTYYYKVVAFNATGEGASCNEVRIGAGNVVPENACVLPGITIVTDPAGDTAPNTPPLFAQQLDLLRVSGAEPAQQDSVNRLVFTLKVSDLSSVPPNASWKSLFTSPMTTTNYFVSMNSDQTSTVTYSYGTITGTQQITLGPASGAFSADGTITLVITDTAVAITGNPAGQTLSAVSGKTQVLIGGGGTGLLLTSDATGTGGYTLVGNASCAANTAPIAVLTATPQQGTRPLTVQLNGSGSHDADPGDTIALYRFTFGDGSSTITQTTPLVSHTYTQAGNFAATLTVTDSRGLVSSNVAQVVVTVNDPVTGTVTTTGTTTTTTTATASGTVVSTGTASTTGTTTATRACFQITTREE